MVADPSRIWFTFVRRARGFDLLESFPNIVISPYFKLCVSVLTPSVPELGYLTT